MQGTKVLVRHALPRQVLTKYLLLSLLNALLRTETRGRECKEEIIGDFASVTPSHVTCCTFFQRAVVNMNFIIRFENSKESESLN